MLIRLLALSLLSAAHCSYAFAQQTRAASRPMALLVGIDRYAGAPAAYAPPPLAGAVNDVERMRRLLVDRFGFANEDVRVLTNEEATHEAIVRAFCTALIDKVHEGSEALFFFAGHGSLAPDPVAEGKGALRPSLIAYDSRKDGPAKPFDVTHYELHSLLTALCARTDRVCVITDACHSAGVTRGQDLAIRAVGPADVPVARAAIEGFWPKSVVPLADADVPQFPQRLVHLAACRHDQTAAEWSFREDGKAEVTGLFTFFLTDELRRLEPGASFETLAAHVGVRMVTLRLPHYQEVAAEGGALRRQVFGGEFGPPLRGFEAKPIADGIEILAGSLHLLQSGTRLLLYDDRGTPSGEVTLDRVEPASSHAQWTGKELERRRPLRAVAIEYPLDTRPLRIAVGASDAAARWARDLALPFRAVGPHDRADCALREADGRVELVALPRELPLWNERQNDARPGLARALETELLFRGLMELPAAPGDVRVDIALAKPGPQDLRKWAEARKLDHPLPADLRDEGGPCRLVAHEKGQMVLALVRVQHHGSREMHVVVISVTEGRQARLIHPFDGKAKDNVLAPGNCLEVPVWLCVEEGWGPREMRDRYYAIVTPKHADFSALDEGEGPERPLLDKLRPHNATRGGTIVRQLLQDALAVGGERGSRGAFGIGTCDVRVVERPPEAPQSRPAPRLEIPR